jgi:hypothetical protein
MLMSRVITAENYNFRNCSSPSGNESQRGGCPAPRILNMSGKKVNGPKGKNIRGARKVNSIGFLFFAIITLGSFYLYQVNDLATKGFEIRDLENRIGQLEKEGKQMEIREVELRSMYNIEKSTEDLNLVSPSSISYLEINGPVAMK